MRAKSKYRIQLQAIQEFLMTDNQKMLTRLVLNNFSNFSKKVNYYYNVLALDDTGQHILMNNYWMRSDLRSRFPDYETIVDHIVLDLDYLYRKFL